MLDRIERGETPDEPPFVALAAAIRRHALPLTPFRDLLSAFRQDVLQGRYASYADVLDYCARSANPIGRLLLQLYAVTGTEQRRNADAICTGLQLANFWQDIALDWRKGRVYVPGEDLTRFEVTEEQIAAGRCDERWSRLLAFEVERARALLESGRALAQALPLRLRLELRLIVAGGLRVLHAIDAVHGDVFRHRPRLRVHDWIAIAPAALLR
jgi:squalene synthase HpnC